jgi:hypothetical protein
MKTAIPNILKELGESEYTVLTSAYCKLKDLRNKINLMHDEYVAAGTPPAFESIEAARLLTDDLYAEVEQYVLSLAEPGEDSCPIPVAKK